MLKVPKSAGSLYPLRISNSLAGSLWDCVGDCPQDIIFPAVLQIQKVALQLRTLTACMSTALSIVPAVFCIAAFLTQKLLLVVEALRLVCL